MEDNKNLIDVDKVTRFEYIDERGRAIVRYLSNKEEFEFLLQDDGQTLKVVLKRK